MLSSFETGIITLINNALKGENQPLPDDFDCSKVYDFGVKHQILPLLYYGGAGNEKFVAGDSGGRLLFTTMSLASISENQLLEIDRVCKEFEKNGIEYLKLKGSRLKKLYPHSEMRIMSDADILIKEEQIDALEKLLPALGYTFVISSDHEWIWKNEIITLELHKRIIATYQKDYYAYFGNGWRLARRINEDSLEYEMSLEDEFIYLFTHLAKHYREAGIGIKHITDIYMFLEKHPTINLEYVCTELDRLRLLNFYKNVKKTIDVWFNHAESDEITEFLTAKIFESGVYGTRLNALKADALKFSKAGNAKKAKRKRRLYFLFLPYSRMCNIFPVLKKAPILLPFFWIWRIIRSVLFRRKHISELNNEINSYSQQEIDEYQLELDYVGLDFNFEV